MKIKVFDFNSKVNYLDDLPKVVKFMKDKGIDIEFTAPIKTNITLSECPEKLYLPNDNKQQEVLMYIFDRSLRTYSYALNFSKTLQVIEISTSTTDDQVDYTWKLICHELTHVLFHQLRNQGIFLDDPMDSMIVNGVKMPYYKNEEPYAPDGNFSEAFKLLAPYISNYKYFSKAELSKWKLRPELWQLLDKMREKAGVPFIISSGLRTAEENKKVGGKSNSAHLKGLAVDLLCKDNFKRNSMLRGILSVSEPYFLEIAKSHLHIDIDSSIHPLNQVITEDDD